MSTSRTCLCGLLGVLPVAFWPGSTSYDPLKFLLLGLFIAVLLADGARSLWRGRPWSLPARGAMLAVGGLVVVMAVSAHDAPNRALVLRTILLTLAGCGAFALTAGSGAAERRRLLVAAQLGGALSGLYALSQWAGLAPGPADHVQMAPGIGGLGNPNYVSGLAAVLFWPAVGMAAGAATRARRGAAVTVAILHVAVMVTSRAAGPPLAVAAAGLLLAPALFLRRGRWAGPAVGGALVLAVAGGLGLGVLASATGGVVSDNPLLANNSGDLRVANWRTALAMLADELVDGQGAGNYPVVWPEARAGLDPAPDRVYGTVATRAHNEYLQWLAETGLLGAVWLLVGGFVLVRFLVRGGGAPLGPIAGLLVVALHAGVSFPLHLPATALVVAVLAGLTAPASTHSIPAPTGWRRPAAAGVMLAAALVTVTGAVAAFRADLAHEQGRRLLRSGDAAAAEPRLQAATAGVLWPGRAHLQLGLAQRHLGRTVRAEASLGESLRQAPSFEAMHLLAEMEIESGRIATAMDRLDLLERCDPDYRVSAEIRYLRGLAGIRQGRLDSARRQLTDLVAEIPHHPRAHLGLGYVAALEGRYGDARRHYTDAIAEVDWNLAHGPAADQAGLRGLREVARRALVSVSDKPDS